MLRFHVELIQRNLSNTLSSRFTYLGWRNLSRTLINLITSAVILIHHIKTLLYVAYIATIMLKL